MTAKASSTSPSTPIDAVIAANRFGLGARPGELSQIQSDPNGWLISQLTGKRAVPEAIATLPDTPTIFKKFYDAQAQHRAARENKTSNNNANSSANIVDLVKGVREVIAPIYLDQIAARYRVAVHSEESFRERLVHFWTNHFAVSTDKVIVLGLAGALENEAIRPHIGGSFSDMLLAVESHPAMILYLDNQQSAGPNSQLAQKLERRRARGKNDIDRKIGINENLAREILELHTLGVNSGYSQKDVTTFATALTGWSVGGGRGAFASGDPGTFLFRPMLHEAGTKEILGKRYSEQGDAQVHAVLKDLGNHPATAKHIATKLVRHFIADDPPASAIDSVSKSFLDSHGDLPTVHRAVVENQLAWQATQSKFKTPHEFVVSTLRAFDYVPNKPREIAAPFELLGQRPYAPGSPAGWADQAGQWDGPDALMKRIEWSTQVGQRAASRVDPIKLADDMLSTSITDHTKTAIARASSKAQAMTLLLMSPEFQRR
jgi:uncharacterized protein (DUF1800 family)